MKCGWMSCFKYCHWNEKVLSLTPLNIMKYLHICEWVVIFHTCLRIFLFVPPPRGRCYILSFAKRMKHETLWFVMPRRDSMFDKNQAEVDTKCCAWIEIGWLINWIRMRLACEWNFYTKIYDSMMIESYNL